MQPFIHDRNYGLIRSKTPQISDNNQRFVLDQKNKSQEDNFSYNKSIISRRRESLKSPRATSTLLFPLHYTKSEDKKENRQINQDFKASVGSGIEIAPFCNGDKISFTTAEDKCETKAKKQNHDLYHQKYSSEDRKEEEPSDGFASLNRHSIPQSSLQAHNSL